MIRLWKILPYEWEDPINRGHHLALGFLVLLLSGTWRSNFPPLRQYSMKPSPQKESVVLEKQPNYWCHDRGFSSSTREDTKLYPSEVLLSVDSHIKTDCSKNIRRLWWWDVFTVTNYHLESQTVTFIFPMDPHSHFHLCNQCYHNWTLSLRSDKRLSWYWQSE